MAFILPLFLIALAVGLAFGAAKLRLKTPFKIAAFALAVGIGLYGVTQAVRSGVVPMPASMKAMIPEKSGSLAGADIGGVPASYELAAQPVNNFNGCPRILAIAWNGVAPLTVANGGARTANGSLVAKYTGGCVQIERQDDYNVQKDEFVKFSEGVSKGEANPQGAAFVIFMGDSAAAYFASLSERLDRIDQRAEVIAVSGFSYGEDKCMGKPLNGNPQNARGSVIAAVPWDGDWNTCVKWASDNDIPVNVNNATYDKNAINFADTTSFVEADEKYISGACEERSEVIDGRPTGKKVQACVDGVATWFPGDRVVVTQKGGLTTWASTFEYNRQMPAVLVGNAEWMAKNKQFVVGLIRAIDRGAFQIRSGGQGLEALGRTQAAVFGTAGGEEARADFWTKGYTGYDYTDGQGNTVRIGGSRAVTAAEVRDYFGLTAGTLNAYKGVYETFGNYAKAFYPKDVPSYPDYGKVVNTSYLQAALGGVNVGSTAQAFEQKSITQAVSERAYAVEFATGSAQITSAGMRTLNDIANQAGMTGLRIRIAGHTDNTGNAGANLALSRARAQAIADALNALAPQTFPKERMQVQGFGDSSPVGDNATEAGRTKNRRVEIALGQ